MTDDLTSGLKVIPAVISLTYSVRGGKLLIYAYAEAVFSIVSNQRVKGLPRRCQRVTGCY